MKKGFRIRKLTPTECAKLMGLNKSDDEKLQQLSVSDTSRFKAYGNGIITNCVSLILNIYIKHNMIMITCVQMKILHNL